MTVRNFLDSFSEIEMAWKIYALYLYFNIFEIFLFFDGIISVLINLFEYDLLSLWSIIVFIYWTNSLPEFTCE